ncbi:MAG: AraC family transcriptional regulator [Bacteroidetes bacterium]|nr:AraC family transcriptional regulator [Bacteroidota bacterium]
MGRMHLIDKIELTPPKHLKTLVENRRVFNLNNCELNIYESYQKAFNVPLVFKDLVITSMVTGRKVMHLADQPDFEYLPGETVILPPNQAMIIDFPESTHKRPTQCIALTVNSEYIEDTMQYLNESYNINSDDEHEWNIDFSQYHFSNDAEIAATINRIIRNCSSNDAAKNIYADLSLKELLIRLVQSQYLKRVEMDRNEKNNFNRQHFLVDYIHRHLTEKLGVDALSRKAYMSRNEFFKWFRQQFGISPLEYINRERIKLAKQLLSNQNATVTETAYQCGFTDVNYFVRVFKKSEGITPGTFKDFVLKDQ